MISTARYLNTCLRGEPGHDIRASALQTVLKLREHVSLKCEFVALGELSHLRIYPPGSGVAGEKMMFLTGSKHNAAT